MKNNKSQKTKKSGLFSVEANVLSDRKAINDQLVYGIIQWSFCIICTILLFGGLGFLITKFYHPDTTSIIEAAIEKCIVNDFTPEPVESLLYRLGLILIPSFLLFFYYLTTLPFFKKIAQNKSLAYALVLLATAGIAFLGYYVFAQGNPTYLETVGRLHNERDRIAVTNYDFFFKDTFLDAHLSQYFIYGYPFYLYSICLSSSSFMESAQKYIR